MVWFRRILAAAIGGLYLLSIVTGATGLFDFFPKPDAAAFVKPEDARALEAPFNDLIAGRDDALKKQFSPSVDLGNADQAFAEMRKAAAGASMDKRRLIRVFWTEGSQGRTISGVHELDLKDRVVRVDTQLTHQSALADWQILNFHVLSMDKRKLADERMASLLRMPMPLVIVAVFLSMSVSVAAAIACLLANELSRRWLWFVFVLVGFGMLRVDALGGWAFQPIWIQLFSGGFAWSGSAFDPWVFSLAAPVGAIVFWFRRLTAKRPGPATDS